VAQGYDLVTWTYDPLEARNAYFNLSKLRATATDYKTDYYGSMTGGPAAGLPTDRLWMEWAVKSPGVSARFELFLLRSGISWPSHIREVDLVQGAIAADVEDFQEPCSVFEPLEVRDGILAPPPETMLELDSPSLSVEVPTSLRAVRDILGHKDALYWRLAVRKAFQTYLQSGYTATGFQRREGGGRYLLVQRGREKIPRRS
jgi:predicted GNAT superfamily acetyltransferase